MTDATGIVLVLIPGGSGLLGAQHSDPTGANYDSRAEEDEVPPVEVKLASYFISKYEVTQAQWERMTDAKPSYYGPDTWGSGEPYPDKLRSAGGVPTPTHPVEGVSWVDCDATCRRFGLTLPTEAQWERAARAGTGTPWWTGTTEESLRAAANISGSEATNGDKASEKGNWPDTDPFPLHAPVDALLPNGYGLHGVMGNVWEWCADRYESNRLSGKPKEGDGLLEYPDVESQTAPRNRVDRGGSYLQSPYKARVSNRSYERADFVDRSLGLRPARRLDP